MKRFKINIILLAILGLVFVSCDNDLDQSPFDELGTDQAYETPGDFENAIRGVYEALVRDNYYGGGDSGDLISLADVLADNVVRNVNGRGTKRSLFDYDYDAANAPHMGLYRDAYTLIFRANLLLKNAEESELDQSLLAEFVAEARALRGIAHFDIVKYFGKIPSQGGDLGLGVAYVTEPDSEVLPERLGLMETYDKILEDLQYAYDNIEETPRDGRLNKEAIALYLSRVYLYMAKDSDTDLLKKVVDYADEVTTAPASREELADVFVDNSNAGLVFYITNNPGSDGLDLSEGVTWSQGSLDDKVTAEYNVTKSFYELFDDSDIRKTVFMAQGVDNNDNPGIFITKYFGKEGKFDGKVNFKILRASEALLNKAEAEYKLGNEQQALDALDDLRSVRYENFNSNGETGQDLWDAIKLERRFEFAFEYNRFLDIKRWGDDVVRFDEGYRADGTGQGPRKLTMENSDRRMVLPYSRESINRNPSIKQNPGYEGDGN